MSLVPSQIALICRHPGWDFVAASLWLVMAAGCDAPPSTAPKQPGGPAASSPPGVREPPSAAAADASPIRLSAGTSLPQTTSAGAAMSFSVDYRIARPLNAAARCLLVIEGSGGKRSGQPTELGMTSGTLQVFVHGWKPDDGPFEARIDEIKSDGTRRPISKSIPLP